MIKTAHYGTGTGNLFLRLVKNRVMKAYGTGSTAPYILNFFTRYAKKRIENETPALASLDIESKFTINLLGHIALETSV